MMMMMMMMIVQRYGCTKRLNDDDILVPLSPITMIDFSGRKFDALFCLLLMLLDVVM
jgi:hypothetical protein